MGDKSAYSASPLVRGLPLLGTALQMAKDPCRFFADMYFEHGPVYRLDGPGLRLVMMAGPEANRFFARKGGDHFSAHHTYARVRRDLGTDVYPNAVDGDAHRKLILGSWASSSSSLKSNTSYDPGIATAHRLKRGRYERAWARADEPTTTSCKCIPVIWCRRAPHSYPRR